ncbi:MAG: hypothetical protein Q9164_005967 [Protoblastenia rupestris]
MVSKIILGAASFGSPDWQEWVLDEDKAIPLLRYAFQRGINTWDTADVYSNGRSEEIIGKVLSSGDIPREKVVILSKCYFGVDRTGKQRFIPEMSVNDGDMVNQVGLSRKHIMAAVKASIERLRTYIDVLQIHRLDDTPMTEIVDTLHDLVTSGKVHYIGASTMYQYQFQGLQNMAQSRHKMGFVSMQSFYNLLYREEEREMMRFCRESKIGCLAWSPLARGILARPWGCKGSIREMTDHFLDVFVDRHGEASLEIVKRVEEMARYKGVTMAAVALAWCLYRGVNPVVGMNTHERIDQSLQALQLKLSEAEFQHLEEPYVTLPVAGFS